MGKTPKTLNEYKLEYARKISQTEIRDRVIIREVSIMNEEIKRFQKARFRANQHANDAHRNLEIANKSASQIASSCQRLFNLCDIDSVKIDDAILDDPKIVELKSRGK